MEQDDVWLTIRHFLRRTLTFALVAGLIGGVISWLSGSRTWSGMGDGLTFTGLVVIALGFFITQGGWGVTRNFNYQQAESAGGEDIPGRLSQAVQDLYQSYSLMFQAFFAGILLFILGAILSGIQ